MNDQNRFPLTQALAWPSPTMLRHLPGGRRTPHLASIAEPRISRLTRSVCLALGLGMMLPPAWSAGAGGSSDDTQYPGGSGTGSASYGNGGTGGLARSDGNAGVDSAGNAIAGGARGPISTDNTGAVGSGGAGSTGQTISSTGNLASGSSIAGSGGGGGGFHEGNYDNSTMVYQSNDFSGGAGGTGLRISGSNLSYTSAGTITGGGGGGGGHTRFYIVGLVVTSATTGAADGGAGGNAVEMTGSGVTLTNTGTIGGGGGGAGGSSVSMLGNGLATSGNANGGAGGTGLKVTGATATINNSGSIAGGNGGTGGASYASAQNQVNGYADGGAGGTGVALAGGDATLTNSGSISGGNGGAGGDYGSPTGATSADAGGVGVLISSNSNRIINSGTISGGLSGDGSTRANAITINGSNNVVELQSGYNFTGNVVVASGSDNALRLGGTTDGSFDVGTLVASLPSSYSGSARYYGFSAYQKTGTSTWTLTGTSTLGGTWTVYGGQLVVSGTMTSTGFIVNTGGMLSGTGSTNNIIIDPGGTLYADTLGSGLTVNGNLMLNDRSTYQVKLDSSGAAGITTVNGNITIGSGVTLKLVSVAGTYTAGTRYTIASYTGTETGSFASIDHSFAYVAPTVSYSGGTIAVSLSANPATPSTVTDTTTGTTLNTNDAFNSSGFAASATSRNQVALANALTRIYNRGGNALTGALITATTDEARNALATMSGDVVGSAATLAQGSVATSQGMIVQRLSANAVSATGSAVTVDADPWIAVSLTQSRQDAAASGASGYRNRSTALSFGHDETITHSWLAGFAFSANHDQLDYSNVSSNQRSTGGQASLYARYQPELETYFFKGIASAGMWAMVGACPHKSTNHGNSHSRPEYPH